MDHINQSSTADREIVLSRLLHAPRAQERDDVVTNYGAREGGKQTLERLAEHVEKQ